MATSNGTSVLNYEAGADLSAAQYLLVKQHTVAGQAVLCGNGENALGVLDEPASAAGRAIAISHGGKQKAYAGGTVAIGANVSSDADGKVVTSASGDVILGVASTAGVADAMIEFVWDKNGLTA